MTCVAKFLTSVLDLFRKKEIMEPPPSPPLPPTLDQKCLALIEEAKKYIGVTEQGGDNKGPDVERFQSVVDGVASGESWCLAFVQYCVRQVDTYLGCKNWMVPTEHVMRFWNMMPDESKIKGGPRPGCLVIWQYYQDGQQTINGHIGIVTKVIDSVTFETIEGNTGPGSAVEREGDGVYTKTRRLVVTTGSMRVKGFVLPWSP
jgi:hypothetical protein